MNYVLTIILTFVITSMGMIAAAESKIYTLEQTRIIECTRYTENSTDVCEQIVRGMYESGEGNTKR